jgi:hypothetical protein
MCCIFGDKNQWASIRQIAPKQFHWHAQNEQRFGLTIKQGLTVLDQANDGASYCENAPQWLIDMALSQEYPYDEVFVPDGYEWQLPAGAYKRCGGPT